MQSFSNIQQEVLSVNYFYPERILDFASQIDFLFSKICSLKRNEFPIKLTFFVHCRNKEDFIEKYILIRSVKERNHIKAPAALISQDTFGVPGPLLEVFILHNLPDSYKTINDENYLIIKSDDAEILFAITESYHHTYFDENVKACFNNLNGILSKFNFKYSDVLRQWNYIGNILKHEKQRNEINQHYQIFNNFRSINYSNCNFESGYPVATGIGTSIDECCIDVIAIKGNNFSIDAIHNNQQIDAYCYSESVLGGLPQNSLNINSSPKFERARFFKSSLINLLFVSGTASIIGENTVCKGDIVGQTNTTISNIEVLLNQARSLTGTSGSVLNYRAYVKRPDDCQKVKEICEDKFGCNKGIILIADICRDDLLVEIECNYFF